jgi:glycosyltransferase involved in cell wall biosynthesis
MKKKKILVISDSPLVPSGVGTQTKYFVDSLIKTGEFKFLCIAGAIKHVDYRMQKVEPYGEDFMILPVNGYGDQALIRQVMEEFKPDLLWFMTDPRFYVWLWSMDNEIRKKVPMVYYHVWDNYPYPDFNKKYYDSNDMVCTISKVTDDIVKKVSPTTKSIRVPHAVDTEIFCKKSPDQIKEKRKLMHESHEDKLVFFWNNRNARRKQSGSLIFWFKDFLDKVGHDKAILIMHTEPKDPNGQDLVAIMNKLGLTNGEVRLSQQKMLPEDLAMVYSSADCTINIADAEGFGLATLESLACETPIIVNMTGGLQEQVTDGEEWFGYGIEPSSKCIIGSQEVPWIYEDRISKEDFLDCMMNFYNLSKEERSELGRKGRQHVLKNYGFDTHGKQWYKVINDAIEEFGSWDNRKNYKHWSFEEL